jgi:phosphoketolase
MTTAASTPAFAEGIQYFGEMLPSFDTYGKTPAIAAGQSAIANSADPAAAFQTLLYADALRYLTIQGDLPVKPKYMPPW